MEVVCRAPAGFGDSAPPQGPQVISYDSSVWSRLPTLNFLRNQDPGEYWRMGPAGGYSALGTNLPAPNELDYGRMAQVERENPGLVRSLWRESNRDWEQDMARAKEFAPTGWAVDPSTIRTMPVGR